MSVQNHLRNTFLAGAFAAMPIAATAFIVYYVERVTRELFAPLDIDAAGVVGLAGGGGVGQP